MGDQSQRVNRKQAEKTRQKSSQPAALHTAQPAISKFSESTPFTPERILALQRSAGNQAVGRFLQAKLAVSQPGDRYEQEAEQISNEVMARPKNHLGPGEPLSIQRFSGGPGNLIDSAPPSVDQALSSPGQPLETGLRQDMEQRFGQDFSGVQVHTGDQAQQSAQEMNAQAYTVGDNIVFNLGTFSPGTQEGQKLIAHELTHVVQQSGAGQGKQIARKATIALEGWGSNIFGHDNSEVNFTPTADFKTAGYQQDMEALKDEDYLAQFYRQQVGLKEGDYSHSEMLESGGYGGTLKIKAGKKGQVTINVVADFDMDEKSNDTYTSAFTSVWDVEADLQGKLTIRRGKAWQTDLPGSDAPFQLTTFNVDQDDSGGYVRVAPQYNSYQIGDTPTSIGGTIGIGDKDKGIQGGINWTPGHSTTYPQGVIQPPFEVKIEVTDIPVKEPTGTVTIGPVTGTWISEHEVFFNRENNYILDQKDEIALVYWYNTLTDDTKKKIEAGNLPIELQAYTSTTADVRHNRKLSQQRAQEVEDALKSVASQRAQVNYKAYGELETPTDDNIKDPKWLKVVASVQEEVTVPGDPTP